MMPHTSARRAFRFVGVYLLISMIFAILALLLCFAAEHGVRKLSTTPTDVEESHILPKYCIVIDAGHGGEDGGAVGGDGLVEKTVNLRIAELLQIQLKLAGIPCVMTRSDDRLLYDPTVDYHGRKKMLDLRARLDMVRDTPGAVLVSIHQNAYTQSRYSGLQVYYSKNDAGSAVLAELVQTGTQRWLQPDNRRPIKAADSAIYLLDRSTCPAILVECGFLSNPDECARLQDDAYLGQLSTVMFSAICEYLKET